MPINISLPDDFFSDDEYKKFQVLFKNNDKNSFVCELGKIACSALTEYKQMIAGNGMPTSVSAIQQNRLYLLIKHFFRDSIPTEDEVSHVFQMTPSQSKSLIRNTLAKYRYELEDDVKDTLRATLKNAEPCKEHDPCHCVHIKSASIVEELNRIIGEKAPKLRQVAKSKEMSKMYDIDCDPYRVLCEHLGILMKDTPCVNVAKT